MNNKWIMWIVLIFLFITFIIWLSANLVKYFIGSVKNIRFCGDQLFDEIDYYNKHWGETKEHYQNMVNVIEFYYKKGGKVDVVVGRDLKRLYNRLEFLERGLNTKEHLITCIISVGLSICATIFFEYLVGDYKNHLWYGILFIVLFFAIALFRYFEPFNEASNQIYKYEIKQLEKKIAKTEEDILVYYEREDILLTKQNLLNILIDKCKFAFAKKCEDVVNDIEKVEKLDLNIKNIASFKELTFKMGKTEKEGVLFLTENKKLANEQYEMLYKILRKYSLIYEINEDDE